jgi:hypothetical protein
VHGGGGRRGQRGHSRLPSAVAHRDHLYTRRGGVRRDAGGPSSRQVEISASNLSLLTLSVRPAARDCQTAEAFRVLLLTEAGCGEPPMKLRALRRRAQGPSGHLSDRRGAQVSFHTMVKAAQPAFVLLASTLLGLQARLPPCRPRRWASLLSLCSHRNAWADWHLLGLPDTFLAASRPRPASRQRCCWSALASPSARTARSGSRLGRVVALYHRSSTLCQIY